MKDTINACKFVSAEDYLNAEKVKKKKPKSTTFFQKRQISKKEIIARTEVSGQGNDNDESDAD